MNKLEVRWVIISVLFAFLPLVLLVEPSAAVSQLHPVFDLFKDPALFLVYSQLAVLGLNFTLMGAKAVAFKFFKIRIVVSALLMMAAFVPVFLAGKYSVALALELLPQSPLPVIVITFFLIGVSAMLLLRALEIWTVPSRVLERLARIKSAPLTSQA